MVLPPRVSFPGDLIAVETPVPFSNTVVKHCEPMIVPTSVKVGIAGIFKQIKPLSLLRGFFCCAFLTRFPVVQWPVDVAVWSAANALVDYLWSRYRRGALLIL